MLPLVVGIFTANADNKGGIVSGTVSESLYHDGVIEGQQSILGVYIHGVVQSFGFGSSPAVANADGFVDRSVEGGGAVG